MYWDPVPTVVASAALPVIGPEHRTLGDPDDYLRGRWDERDWRNVPGPFYGANTDSCWVGRLIAPDHVVYEDGNGSEVVFRQPCNARETRLLLSAAWADPYCGYAYNGDDHWTLELIRDWWADRARLAEWLSELEREWSVHDRDQEREAAQGLRAYSSYLHNGLETSLQNYAFWLDNRRPAQPHEALPSLSS
ncbi:ferredoxin [Nocardia rhizosphaerihabitans]|uniref:ferredoxin n=1 Tax=Nocardia rhizosphaerihabitans TaxID=1691570 RepID=UPI00367017AF